MTLFRPWNLLLVLPLAGCSPTIPTPLGGLQGALVYCGDGYLDAGEICDDGVNDGSYGSCAADCSARAAHCGDGLVDLSEGCDDGVNDGAYGSCVFDCSAPIAFCGDGEVNGPELCDDGLNDGRYGGCEAGCHEHAIHCGDGETNGPEICDDAINDASCGSCLEDCSDVGRGLFLTQLRVTAIGDDSWGWPGDWDPDIFLEVTDVAGREVYVTSIKNNDPPPVTWNLPDVPVEEQTLRVHAWDDDGGLFLGADDLGEVQFHTTDGAGSVSSGDLTISFIVDELPCD